MKKTRFVLCLLLSCLVLCSCSAIRGDYVTRSELEDLKNLQTSEPGNEYTVNITTDADASKLGASKALLSVVSIKSTFEEVYSSGWWGSSQSMVREKSFFGAGVIYRLDKEKGNAYIITNYHVVYNNASTAENGISDDIKVFLYGQENDADAIAAEFVGGSSNYDIAVLKVTSSAILKQSIASAATISDSDKISVLDTAIAIGNPAGMGISATAGFVSVDSEDIKISVTGNGYVNMRVMRVDTAVNGGNSGGGLFDENGNLIGIVNAKIADYSIENIAYAIPSNVARHLTESILSNANGSATRCILGVTPATASSKAVYDTETGKISILETVSVSSVSSGSFAEGKLEVGDVIRSMTIDGKTLQIQRKFQVIENMFAARVGSTVAFEIERNGQAMTVTFEITEDMVTTM